MTRISTRRRSTRAPAAPPVHAPHWSWTRKESAANQAKLAPEDFWSRLEL